MSPRLSDQSGKFARFTVVGLAAFLVDGGGMQGLIALGLDPFLARAVSLPTAMLVAYGLNRRFTFNVPGPAQADEFTRYLAVTAASALTSYLVFAALLAGFPSLWPLAAVAGGLAVSMWVSFIGFQVFAFPQTDQRPTNR
ncbi:MAG: GtrA family protein [Pseudomonadota bacterium]